MEYIVIYRWLELQQNWPLQVSALIISAFHIPSTTIQNLSSQLFYISSQNRRVFAHDVEELDTNIMISSSVVQNFSQQVLEEI